MHTAPSPHFVMVSTCFPNDILRAIGPAFDAVFAPDTLYRATGVILHHFSEAYYGQLDLFGEVVRIQRLSNLYESVDALSAKYGKHPLFLAASLPAHLHAQHAGDRGELPERHLTLLPRETRRKRLGIPMFLGKCNSDRPVSEREAKRPGASCVV